MIIETHRSFFTVAAAAVLLWWGTAFLEGTRAFPFLAAFLWGLTLFLVMLFPRHRDTRADWTWILILAFACQAGILVSEFAGNGFDWTIVASRMLDVVTVLFLSGVLLRRGLPMRWALLYACNPLAMLAPGSGGASILVFWVTGALYLYHADKWRLMYLLLGAGAATSPLFIVFAGFYINRNNIRYLGWVLPGMGAFLFLMITAGMPALVDGGMQNVGEPALSGPLAVLIPDFIFLQLVSRQVLLCLALAPALWLLHPVRPGRLRNDPVPGLFFAAGLILFTTPRVLPAFFMLLAPFIVLCPNALWCFFYLVLFFLPQVPPGPSEAWFALWWSPLYAAVLLAGFCQWKRFTSDMRPFPCRSISVVIPALNEQGHIGSCIASIRAACPSAEVIVVDGGSSDLTRTIAQQNGARVVVNARHFENGGGRGGQIRTGVHCAIGDVVAVVHADAQVPQGALNRMLDVLNKNPGVAGGVLGCRFNAKSPCLTLVEWLNDVRMAFFGIGFGDQIQFFRRHPVVDNQLLPAIPLMEDVELSIRLAGLGRQVHLFEKVTVSSRRWQQKGATNGLMVIGQVALYLVKRLRGVPDTAGIYKRYYSA